THLPAPSLHDALPIWLIAASEHCEDLLRSWRQCRLLLRAQATQCGEGEAHAPAGLVVLRVDEADEAHLVEHASDPLTSLLGDSEVRADACDPWIARVSGDVQGIGRVRQPGEAAGALDLDS